MSKEKDEDVLQVRFPVSGDEARDAQERKYAMRLLAENTLSTFEEGVYYVVSIRHEKDCYRPEDYGAPHEAYFVEIARAERRRVVIPEIPDLFSAMPTRVVAYTAVEELKHRVNKWVGSVIKKFTGK